jgi:hypothetical protein
VARPTDTRSSPTPRSMTVARLPGRIDYVSGD